MSFFAFFLSFFFFFKIFRQMWMNSRPIHCPLKPLKILIIHTLYRKVFKYTLQSFAKYKIKYMKNRIGNTIISALICIHQYMYSLNVSTFYFCGCKRSRALEMLPSTVSKSWVNQPPSLLKPIDIIAINASLTRASEKKMNHLIIILLPYSSIWMIKNQFMVISVKTSYHVPENYCVQK